jgi:hypothetical protein
MTFRDPHGIHKNPKYYPLVMTNIAMENGSFLEDL